MNIGCEAVDAVPHHHRRDAGDRYPRRRLPAPGAAPARTGGYDYTQAVHFEHFNLLYYEPLVAAAAEGLDTLHLGVDAYQTKLRRGGRPCLVWAVLYRPDGAWPVCATGSAPTTGPG